MTKHEQQLGRSPLAILGAGDLVSHLQANGLSFQERYRFNLFRLNQETGEPICWLRPEDLRDVVKACQVLAFAIADDGWVSDELRQDLRRLSSELDSLTLNWSESR